MKKYLTVVVAVSMILFACGADTGARENTEKESYQLTKQELLKKEQKTPVSFLAVRGKNKKNLLGQTVIRGTVTNEATLAVFKDVSLKLSFYSKTRTLLETDKETVFETLHPGDTKSFKTKYFAPKGTDSVALEIIAAKVVAQ